MIPEFPIPKKALIWTGILNQTSTNAPTATLTIPNTFGTITWTRQTQATYIGTANGKFPAGKVTILIGLSELSCFIAGGLVGDGNAIYITTQTTDGTPSDDLIANLSIQIIVKQ